MATESYKSTKAGDAKFKPSVISVSQQGRNVNTMTGGKRSSGVSNDALKQMGRNLARVANQGKV